MGRFAFIVSLTLVMSEEASACRRSMYIIDTSRFLSDDCIRLIAHEYAGHRRLIGAPRRIQRGNVTIDDYQEHFLVAPDCSFTAISGLEPGLLVTKADGFSLQFSDGREMNFTDQTAPWSDVLDCTER